MVTVIFRLTNKRTTITMLKERDKCPLSSTLLFLLPTILSVFPRHASADDATVMVKFAQSLNRRPAGWTDVDPCKWSGVSCDSSKHVHSIDISSQSLSGTVPSEINQLSQLRSLSLQQNLLYGPVPDLSGLKSLEELYFDGNSFTSLPSGFLSGLPSLQSVNIDNNIKLPAWTIPTSLKDSGSLKSFSASKANVVGEIPNIFGSLLSLQSLRLSYNNLTGWLPWSFAKAPIHTLWLNNQETGLSGRLDVLGSMKYLTSIWLQANQFSGPIPDLLVCTELFDLQLRDNALTGMIPDSITKLPKLQNVTLQNNKFQGSIPVFPNDVHVTLGTTNNFCLPKPGPCDPQVSALLEAISAMNYPMILSESWKGNDACQQWQFITCDEGSVSIINFGKQNWTGFISPAFSKLSNLKSLLLNDNQFNGRIPASLTSLKYLEMLDVSNNNLSGKIPKFPPSVTIKTFGNPFIGKELGEWSPFRKALIIFVVFVIIFVAVFGFLVYRRIRNKKTKSYQSFVKGSKGGYSGKQTIVDIDPIKDNVNITSGYSSTFSESSLRCSPGIAYDGVNITIPFEVLREVTNNFNENNVLGRGGFGIVYRGQLHDGTRIAVKRMESSMMSEKGLHEFKAEIEVLTKVRHRNLVSLHGFCNNGSERLLVYEYMPQGSLGQHLFHWKELRVPPLTWNQRVTIVLDVARGIEYLHSMAQQSFIHRDLKPSNILLGDDMRAKVSDFGLVRTAPDGNYSIETRLAGTFGYLAPEYAATGRVTTKVDVYSFGVVLMEIITGRKALDGSLPDEEVQLVTWFRNFLQDKEAVKDALDPVLLPDMDEENFHDIWKVAELAGYCSAREAYHRPDMSHAVNVLSSLVDNWKPSPERDEGFDIDIHMSLPQALQKWKANEGQSTTTNSGFFTGYMTNQTTSTNSIATSDSTLMNMKSRDSRTFPATIDERN